MRSPSAWLWWLGTSASTLPPAREPERVEDLGAAKRLVHDFGLLRGVVVVDDVVGPQQHLHLAAPAAHVAADLALVRDLALQQSELDLDLARVADASRQEHALADEVGDEAVRRPVIEVVGEVPLLDPPRVHDADLVGDRERFVLVVGDQHRGGAGAP